MFSDPLKNLKTLGIRESDIVADLGAGTGFYTLAAGHMVPQGKVYAVEVQKDFVAKITNRAREEHLDNVECFWGNIEKLGGTKIKDGIVDVVIVSNVLFQVEDRDLFIQEIKRIAKPGAKVLLIDWSDSSSLGLLVAIPKAQALEMFEHKGFAYERDIDAGHHHYGMILTKSNER
jgi:ubiquinone/menaquinone biosynthesis C-methylase UbiE